MIQSVAANTQISQRFVRFIANAERRTELGEKQPNDNWEMFFKGKMLLCIIYITRENKFHTAGQLMFRRLIIILGDGMHRVFSLLTTRDFIII